MPHATSGPGWPKTAGNCDLLEAFTMPMKILILSLLVLLPTVASAHGATSKGVTVAHPWARATPGGATIGTAFLEIKTDKNTSDRLIGVSSPVAGRAEVHSHSMDGGVMKMRRVDGIDLKPGESHILKPMGEHIMLFDLKQPLKEGDLVKLTLTFAKAGPIEVNATVEPMAAMGPHGLDHQPVDDSMTDSMSSHDKMMSHDEMHGEMHHNEHSQ
jgi:periplasmic copper chaperone A